MSNHTPGPWRVGDAGFTVFGPPNGNPSPETVATVRKRANSHLIAAAAEMLEELKRLHEEGGCGHATPGVHGCFCDLISKAEGQKP